MINLDKLPSWMYEKENCLFCYKSMKPYDILIRDNDVLVKYQCGNDSCTYLKFDYGKYIFTIVHTGYTEMYEEFITRPDPVVVEEKKEEET